MKSSQLCKPSQKRKVFRSRLSTVHTIKLQIWRNVEDGKRNRTKETFEPQMEKLLRNIEALCKDCLLKRNVHIYIKNTQFSKFS